MITLKKVLADFDRCLGCLTCELACATAHSKAGTFLGAVLGGEEPPISVKVVAEGDGRFPMQCRHCTDAPCVHACVVSALVRDEATGRVTCDAEKCLGCMMCVLVCPFGAISEGTSHKVTKCDLCEGVGEPSCVAACPTGALSFEEINDFSNKRRHSYVFGYRQEMEGNPS